MKYLNIAQKLALLGVLFLIPFAIVTYKMVSSIKSEKVDFAKLELMGTRYYVPLSALLKDLQEHDSSTTAWLCGDASFGQQVAGKELEISGDVNRVNKVDQALDPGLHTSAEWKSLRGMIDELLSKDAKRSAAESMELHQKVIDATLLLISKVSDNSKLTLDPDMDTYYLMNAIMFQGPATSDFLSRARSLQARIAASGSGTSDDFNELHRLSILADFSQDGVADSLSRVFGFNPSLLPELGPAAQANAAGVKENTTAIQNMALSRKLDASVRGGNETLTSNMNRLFELEDHATATLDRLLKIRIARWQREIAHALGFAAMGLIAVLVIGFFIMRDITVPLQRVVTIANKIARGEGDYAIRAIKQSDDELGVLIDAFNKMMTQIQERETDLTKSKAELEERVVARTQDVMTSLALVRATLESTADGIIVTDDNGWVTSFNERFLEICQVPRPPDSEKHDETLLAAIAAQLSDSRPFLGQIHEMQRDPERESFDVLTFNDGRTMELYSKPQRVEETCVGRVWSFRDITERKRAEEEMEKMHRRLIDTSRQAGMAEVATSVLHNVGNVLNSVNVSATLVAAQIKKSKVTNLSKVASLLKEHAGEIGEFLTTDPKGKQLPGYLGQLADNLTSQQTLVMEELERLQKNIDHIKEIVAMQQICATISGLKETVKMVDLVEDALRLEMSSLHRHGFEVVRDYENVLPMEVEKHKILQILVNLVRNSKHACDESGVLEKRLTFGVAASATRVKISVADNGAGISPENLTRIFSLGFTTRKDGHGFGLHSAVLAAKEMGGSLNVRSEGVNRGATFILELPYSHKEVAGDKAIMPNGLELALAR